MKGVTQKMFKQKPIIQFVSTMNGLNEIEDCLPRPSNKFIPDWWKSVPSNIERTVRNCPSFPDFFSLGYILPMWMDSKISYNPVNTEWNAISSPVFPQWDFHPDIQMRDYSDIKFNGKKPTAIFKAVCPWRVITPPGWSVLQLPLTYHDKQDFAVLPGIIDTDIHHEINQQVMYFGYNEMLFIPQGEPLAMYIPFKRQSINHVVRYQTKKDIDKFNLSWLKVSSKFTGGYRKKQRYRDTKI